MVLVVQEQNEDGSARMSDKALTSQQMPKLQAAFASIVRSSPEGVTALMRDPTVVSVLLINISWVITTQKA